MERERSGREQGEATQAEAGDPEPPVDEMSNLKVTTLDSLVP